VDVRSAFVAQREAAEAMQAGQGAAILDCFLAHATIVQMASKSYRLRTRATAEPTRAVDAAGAMDAENAPTALSSGDDFKNGQKTPCLRTARTYAILTAPAAGWFSNGRWHTSFGKTMNP